MTVTSKLYYYTIPIVVIAVVSSFTASCRIPFQSRYWQSRRTRADISLGLRPQEYISILCGNSAITIIILFSLPLISFKYLPVIYILLPFAYPEPKLDELSAVKLIVDVATSSLRVQIGQLVSSPDPSNGSSTVAGKRGEWEGGEGRVW